MFLSRIHRKIINNSTIDCKSVFKLCLLRNSYPPTPNCVVARATWSLSYGYMSWIHVNPLIILSIPNGHCTVIVDEQPESNLLSSTRKLASLCWGDMRKDQCCTVQDVVLGTTTTRRRLCCQPVQNSNEPSVYFRITARAHLDLTNRIRARILQNKNVS